MLANVVDTLEVLPKASDVLLRTHCYEDLSAILVQGQEESTVVILGISSHSFYALPQFCL